MVQNKGLIFKSVPTDWPVEGKDLTIEDRGFDLDAEPQEDGITTKNYYISFDPFQRGRMRPPQAASYSPPFALGKPITNSAVAKVLKSNNSKFKQGDIVTGTLPTEEYSSISGEVANTMVRKLDNPYKLDPKLFVGALGMPGLTAYSSFYAIGEPKKGETICRTSPAHYFFVQSRSGGSRAPPRKEKTDLEKYNSHFRCQWGCWPNCWATCEA